MRLSCSLGAALLGAVVAVPVYCRQHTVSWIKVSDTWQALDGHITDLWGH
jgi:hypothetical protein